MIPHRMLSNEIPGNGLRNRVTACRKRLRDNRVMLKAHASTVVEELFPESRMNCSFEDAERKETLALLRSLEQEDGIT